MLRELAPDQLWVAETPTLRGGIEFGARSTVVRLPDGGLWVHCPLELTPVFRSDLDALGPVRWVVQAARMHYAGLPDFAAAYPEARFYQAPNFKQAPKGVKFERVLDDRPEPEWAGIFGQSAFKGSRLYDEVDFFHRPTRTLILTDLMFNIPRNRSLFTQFLAAGFGVLGKPSASLTFRLTVRDREAVRQSLERILAWDFDRIILAHGEIIETGGREMFLKVFGAWL